MLVSNYKATSNWTPPGRPRWYLSYVPSFDAVYTMSNEMIIAEAPLDSLGNFLLPLDFIPAYDQLYRLHLSKKSDSKASLIIGGPNENFLVFTARQGIPIELTAKKGVPPFRNAQFSAHSVNAQIQLVTRRVALADSLMAVSGAAKRGFLQQQLASELRTLADTSSNVLVSLYALHSFDASGLQEQHPAFVASFFRKMVPLQFGLF